MIGGMVPTGCATGSGRLLASLVALALAAFAAGCDATGGDDEPRTERGGWAVEIAEGASELGGDEAADGDAGVPDGRGESDGTHVDGQTGIGSPLDDRGGPDPIPWHRTLRDERANDA
jgi:hypothetical protein